MNIRERKAKRREAHTLHIVAMEYCWRGRDAVGRTKAYWFRRAWKRERQAIELWLSIPGFDGYERWSMLRSAAVVAFDAGERLQAYRFASLCLLDRENTERGALRSIINELERTP